MQRLGAAVTAASATPNEPGQPGSVPRLTNTGPKIPPMCGSGGRSTASGAPGRASRRHRWRSRHRDRSAGGGHRWLPGALAVANGCAARALPSAGTMETFSRPRARLRPSSPTASFRSLPRRIPEREPEDKGCRLRCIIAVRPAAPPRARKLGHAPRRGQRVNLRLRQRGKLVVELLAAGTDKGTRIFTCCVMLRSAHGNEPGPRQSTSSPDEYRSPPCPERGITHQSCRSAVPLSVPAGSSSTTNFPR